MNKLIEKILEEGAEKLAQMNEKLQSDLLALKKQCDYLSYLIWIQEEKLIELNLLISAKNCDYDLIEIKFKEQNESMKSLLEKDKLFEEAYEALLHAQLKAAELQQRLRQIVFNLQKALINYNETIVQKQCTQINNYKNGPKKKSEMSVRKWELARKYFAEEIPKHKFLKNARKAAANRVGIFVEDRQLVKMLPDPR